MATFTRTISQSADDATESGGTMNLSGTTMNANAALQLIEAPAAGNAVEFTFTERWYV